MVFPPTWADCKPNSQSGIININPKPFIPGSAAASLSLPVAEKAACIRFFLLRIQAALAIITCTTQMSIRDQAVTIMPG
jgi:hypothetical protein